MEASQRKFALAVGGSFNPVHRSHIKMLELARDTLCAMFGPDCVVGCHLAVAHASHVRGKCGTDGTMTRDHRLAMAAIACDEFGLGKTPDKCFGSSLGLLSALYGHREDVVLVNVVGGDRAKPMKRRAKRNTCTVIIGRKGSGHKKHEFAGRSRMSKSDGIFADLEPPAPNVMMEGNDMYIDVEDDVSSTAIRLALKNMKCDGSSGALQELVDKQLLSRGVAEYIVEHWGKLYESQN